MLTMTGATISILGLIFLIGSISASRHLRIIGGDNTEIEDFPYVVSLRFNGKDFCGGAIITKRHVLTSAHCMDMFRTDLVRVHSGTSRSNSKGKVRKILSVHTHPKWGSSKEEGGSLYNIAVLTLKDPIVFNKYEKKIHLPSHDAPTYQGGYLIGWGRTTSWKPIHPENLQMLRVTVMSSASCQEMINQKISEKLICAYSRRTTGACLGDDGSPLVAAGEIVGIAPFIAKEKCASGEPEVYTNVFAYKDFIESVIKS